MPELKVVKKKKGLRLGGGDTSEAIGGSSLRPRYTPKDPPCAISCPIGIYCLLVRRCYNLQHVNPFYAIRGVIIWQI